MKDYLVDVAVQTYIWVRPEMQRRQFEIIKKARPSVLFVVSDGGRTEIEWEAIHKSRKMYNEEIDWNCTVYRLYEEKNCGMYAMGRKARELVWNHVDACIFVEDDILPSVCYFKFCADMFEKYKDDPRIYGICGMNSVEVNKECTEDYFFSRYGSVWGVALWKRSAEEYRTDFLESPYTMKLLRSAMKEHPSHIKQIESIAASGEYDGHIPSTEFYMNLAVYGHHQMYIIPKYNMVSNIGCDPASAHSDNLNSLPRGVRRLFNMKTYEITWPLKEPKYEIPDTEYERERNRILALDHPVVSAYRKVERFFLILSTGDIKKLKAKVSKYIDIRKMHED